MENDKTASSKSGKKKKTTPNKTANVLKKIILVLLIIILVGGFAALGTAYAWISSAKPLNIDELFSLNQTTYIVDEKDIVIDKLHANENRTIVTLDKIPQQLQDAFIAIEDKRFEKHFGIDIYRIFGAIKADIKEGRAAQGGSTITQQLIKKVYLTDEKVFKRKVIEMYYAIQLERRFTKDQILEAYLNTIPLGHNVAGVKEAALYYFNKDLDQLTLAENAMLAGITNNPSLYSPYRKFENATKRKELILNEMLKQGKISQDEFDQAKEEEIKLSKGESEVETSYFADMVISDVLDVFEEELGYSQEEAQLKLFNGGLKIVATIDTDIQNGVEASFKNDKVFPKSKADANGNLQPEAAAIVIDHTTGQVKAVMGGRSEKVRRGLNRATQSLRQPGSTIKPLAVYAPALDNGYTVASVIDDSYVAYGNYSPDNYSGKFSGLVTVREAIKDSLNVVAVKIVQDVGSARSLDYLKKFGITTMVEKNDENGRSDNGLAQLALGGVTKGIKPIEMAAAYSVFPNKGVYNKPITFTKIYDKDGNLIFENKAKKDRVISEQVAYLMVDIMQGVVQGGTGGRAALPNMPVGGKTGTTTKNLDAWFVGYTPYYTTAVWMGHDEPKNLGFTGGNYPAMLWKDIMTSVHKDLKTRKFEMPSGLVSVEICTESGKRPSELCALDQRGSTIKSEVFIKGTEPAVEDICDIHVVRDIDISTNKLATPYCPTSLVQSKVFIQRLEPADPANTKLPADSIYEAPIENCPLHSSETIPVDPLDPNGTNPGDGNDGDNDDNSDDLWNPDDSNGPILSPPANAN
ncbi:MAG: penicillin-binding protein family [Clostridia bacterium]|jgi:penicillin-binding protein 1A|nr:penicillin-binding protein family [Clostridia bacterium]